MARIVLGIGTSHGPLLSTPPEQWDQRVVADKREPAHPFRGNSYSFDELVAARRSEELGRRVTLEARTAHADRNRVALEVLAEQFARVQPDVAIMLGNDQHECFGPSLNPALWLYAGATVFDEPVSDERAAQMPPGIAISARGHKPTQRETYPAHPELARHLATQLTDRGFDFAQSDELPQQGRGWATGMPHAFGFVYQRIMRGRVIPHVPIMLNTFYPPNQPRAARCVDLGLALAEAVAAWPADLRVALVASGGLTHFVIDEAFDQHVIASMRRNDVAALRALDERILQSGTSEVKNWLPVAAACGAARLKMELVDYVPCYRSEAGTGNAMAFVTWQ